MATLKDEKLRPISYSSETERLVWYSKAHETAARAYFRKRRWFGRVASKAISSSLRIVRCSPRADSKTANVFRTICLRAAASGQRKVISSLSQTD
mmetsp:Transcript_2129/g.7199  ORF Transcript_2129/g.7199 Transcript_2129/m.7199 type:complete len:95 (-) Transcript_2129:289-573(-)